jgi:hypothetical protein
MDTTKMHDIFWVWLQLRYHNYSVTLLLFESIVWHILTNCNKMVIAKKFPERSSKILSIFHILCITCDYG